MSYFSDPKIRFYLRHQEKIDQWAEIQRDVYLETKSFLGSLVDDIETMATDLDRAVTVLDRSDTSNLILLHDPTWGLVAPGRPVISIGLGWNSKPLLRDRSRPYSGVRQSHGAPNWEDLQKRFQQIALEAGHSLPKDDKHWPAYRYLAADDAQYWEGEGLDAYRAKVVNALSDDWATYAPMIDQAL